MAAALAHFLAQANLGKLPLYGVGISSGGVALSEVVTTNLPGNKRLHFTGVHFNVSPGGARCIDGHGFAHAEAGSFAGRGNPPTSFLFMNGDSYGHPAAIAKAVLALRSRGTPVLSEEVKPKPLMRLFERAAFIGLAPNQVATVLKVVERDFKYVLETRGDPQCLVYGKQSCFFLKPGTSDALVGHLLVHPDTFWIIKPKARAFYEEIHILESVHGPTSENFAQHLQWLLTQPRHPVLALIVTAPNASDPGTTRSLLPPMSTSPKMQTTFAMAAEAPSSSPSMAAVVVPKLPAAVALPDEGTATEKIGAVRCLSMSKTEPAPTIGEIGLSAAELHTLGWTGKLKTSFFSALITVGGQ